MDNSNTAAPDNTQPAPSAQPANRNQQQGTGFTNLSRIIGANQNTGLTGAVSGGLQNQTNNVKSGISSAQNQTNSDIQGQNIATDANKQNAQTIINDPTKATDQNVDQFAQYRSGAYNGPTDLENKQNLQNDATQAQTLGGMASSQAGRQALLQRFVGGADYGQGKQTLDSAILGQTGGTQLAQAARGTNGLGQQLNNAATAAQQQSQVVAGGNQQFATDVKNQLNTGLTGIDTSANNAMNQFNYTRDDLLNGITQAGAFDASNPTGNPALSTEQYNALVKAGYDPTDTNGLYNLNLGDYVQRSDFNPTLSSALTSQQAAQAQALAKLSGTDISQQNQALATAAGDSANVGTLANQQAIQFNQDQFAQAQQQAIENEITGYYNQAQGSNPSFNSQTVDNNAVPNAAALIAGLQAGNLSTSQLNNVGGLNLNNTNLAANMNSGNYSGEGLNLDAGNVGYTANGGTANLLNYLNNLGSTNNYYSNTLGFGTGDTALNNGGGFNNYNTNFGGLRSLLNPAAAGTTATTPTDASLVGDNSSNSALKNYLATQNGQS